MRFLVLLIKKENQLGKTKGTQKQTFGDYGGKDW
jgi:hypothetical protein